ncbi:ATP-binding protein [Acidobacteriota bacterium]
MNCLKAFTQISEIDRIREFLKNCLESCEMSEDEYYWIELSVVEICINIIRYAYPEQDGDFSISVWQEGRNICVQIKDQGIPFNPKEAKSPVLEEIIKTERKGGFGIHLARKLMDEFEYTRKEGQNILFLKKNISTTC